MGTAMRWLLLLLLALVSANQSPTSARLDASRGSRWYYPTVCSIPCCKTEPNCTHATSVTCYCPNMGEMTMKSGLFPDTVRRMTIVGVRSITIAEGALARLHRLEDLSIWESTTLHVQAHGLNLQDINRLRLFYVSKVDSVTIHESAFSGQWNTNARIFLSAIQEVTVEQRGFSHSSDSFGPNLDVLNVKLLDLLPAAIAAPISTLHMWQVNMGVCHRGSLGGGYVTRVLLAHSNINLAETGCVKTGLHGIIALNITSSSINAIQNGAFSGKFKDFLITDSTVTLIQTNGFDIDVENLHLNNTQIDTLESRGLSVSATDDILLSRVSVKVLKQHALLGLTARESSTASRPAIRIHGLHVTQLAEDSSLALAACTRVEFEHLTVAPRQPEVCPTERWTRQLTGGAEGGRLTEVQFQVYEQLVSLQSCTDDQHRQLTWDDVTEERCTDTDIPGDQPGTQATPRNTNQPRTEDADSRDDTDRTPPAVDAPVAPGEERAVPPPDPAARGGTASGPVLYSILGVVSALLVAVAACLLVRRHRRRKAVSAKSRDGHQLVAQECPLYVSTESTDHPAQRQLPDVCDYAEPLVAQPADGDYAEIPVSADYAEPTSATGGRDSDCSDYAEVLVLHRRSEAPADDHASLYATVPPSLAAAAAPVERRLSGNEEVPPLPPVTAERLQTPADVTDNMTYNVLYSSGDLTDNVLYAETK